jgi:hypothetical protein
MILTREIGAVAQYDKALHLITPSIVGRGRLRAKKGLYFIRTALANTFHLTIKDQSIRTNRS